MYQPKHLAERPNRKMRAASAAVLVGTLAATSLAIASPASAVLPHSAVITANDANVKSRCQFTVTSANYAAGTVRGRLTAQTAPANLLNSANIAHVAIGCIVLDSASIDQLAVIEDEDDGPYTYETELVTVPLDASYNICAVGAYTLRNGNTGVLYNCS